MLAVPTSSSTSLFPSPVAASPRQRDEQRVRITVEASSLTADSFTVAEDSADNALDVLANDGLGSDALITDVSADGRTGTATIAADGKSIVYTPAADFVGTDRFEYTVLSGGVTQVGEVEVMVENVIDGPTANDDVYPDDFNSDADRELLVEDSSGVILAVLNNDRPDPDQEENRVDSRGNGSAVRNTRLEPLQYHLHSGSPTLSAQIPSPYTIEGVTSGISSTATVTVNVPELNDAPIVVGRNLHGRGG